LPSINTRLFRVHNAAQFYESLAEAVGSTYYAGIGRHTAWTSDLAPPTPTEALANTAYAYWTDVLALKKIASTELSHVVPRADWASNTVYTGYDHRDANLTSFYVMSSSFNVYKCLFNNGGANSTVEPTGTGNTVITTGDGYMWKFMYQISTSEALNFLTSAFMPVKTVASDDDSLQWDVQQYAAASNGALDVILVTAGGTNYDTSTTTVTITGDGTGATVLAGNITLVANVITKITVATRGANYSRANVTITSSAAGAGATAVAIVPPQGYHGADAVKELYSHYVMMAPRFAESEANTIATDVGFRRVMLFKDPRLLSSGVVATGSVYSQTTDLTLTSITGTFTTGETVTGGTSGATGVVVDFDETGHDDIVRVVSVIGTFAVAEVITGGTSAAVGTTSVVTAPLVRPYSGDTLYVEQRTPITRAEDQTEILRVVLAF
jgi:hypothetical protein